VPYDLKFLSVKTMSLWQEYLFPESVEEALTTLESAPGPAAIIAGGTDLLLDLQQGRHPPVHTLVDVSRIRAMQGVRESGDQLYVGAATTHQEIIQHPVLRVHAQCLVEACGLIGGPQVRHVATLGGNVAHALPAGDGTIALLALEAEAQLASSDGTRWESVEALFAGPGEPAFERGRELLIGFRFPRLEDGEASAFQRIMRPQGVAIAILNMAIWLCLREASEIAEVRIAVGPAGPVPFRGRETERVLRGRTLDEATIEEAQGSLLDEVHLRTSRHRATKEYRQHLVGVLLRRTLAIATQRAEGLDPHMRNSPSIEE
jgi:CO/xanthine dehydrogenase FAD-binding subunit